MTVKELKEKLSIYDDDVEVLWDDAIEGNDCLLGKVEAVNGVKPSDFDGRYTKEYNYDYCIRVGP